MAECKVGLWDRFEAVLENKRAYGDPYRDVTLEVEYHRPDGSPVRFWGFYDGGATWRLRFMPDQTGIWTYTARFSDGAPSVEGEFECVPSDLPGMIAVDKANPMWFGFKGGSHILLRSLHVGDGFFAANMPDETRTAFLDWAVGQGYNMLSIGSHYLNRAEPGRGEGWDTPRLWPLEAAEYRKAERILDDLARRRLIVFPFGGFFGRGADHPKTPEDEELYVRYVLARFGAYWNILLNVSGPEPLLVKEEQVWLTKPELERLARLIRRLDVYGHLLTVHNRTGDDEFLDADWVDFGTLQGPKTTDIAALYEGVLKNHRPDRPLYVQETLWSGNKYHPQYDNEQLRRNAIIINMAAGVINFADNGGPRPEDQGDSSSGFCRTLDLADRRQWRHDILKAVWDLFDALPFYRLRPGPELVAGGYALAEPGSLYLVYSPEGELVDVRLEGGHYSVEWINARDTADRRSGGQTDTGQSLRPPQDGGDWFVCLRRA